MGGGTVRRLPETGPTPFSPTVARFGTVRAAGDSDGDSL